MGASSGNIDIVVATAATANATVLTPEEVVVHAGAPEQHAKRLFSGITRPTTPGDAKLLIPSFGANTLTASGILKGVQYFIQSSSGNIEADHRKRIRDSA